MDRQEISLSGISQKTLTRDFFLKKYNLATFKKHVAQMRTIRMQKGARIKERQEQGRRFQIAKNDTVLLLLREGKRR